MRIGARGNSEHLPAADRQISKHFRYLRFGFDLTFEPWHLTL